MERKIFTLLLLAGLFISCDKGEDGNDKDPVSESATINGVTWATRNVYLAGEFAAGPESSGLYYQWNSTRGWTPVSERTDWEYSVGDGDVWASFNDPCPEGWRVPTKDEQASLLDGAKVTQEWKILNGVEGVRFTDKLSGNSVFLPAAARLWNLDGTILNTGNGYYWSSIKDEIGMAWAMYFWNDNGPNAFRSTVATKYGFTIRCVRE